MVPMVASSLPATEIPMVLPFSCDKSVMPLFFNTINVLSGVAIRVAVLIKGKPAATSIVKLG